MNNKTNSLIFKIVFSVLLITGVLSRAGLFGGELQLQTLASFTSITDLYVFAVTLITLYSLKQDNKIVLYRWRILGLIMILVTGIVYHFILLPEKYMTNPNYQVFTYGNIVAHYITPCLMFVDWFLFDKKGLFKKWDPLLYSAVPILYFIAASIYGYFSSSYVYFIIDFDKLGVLGVLGWAGLIWGLFLALTYAIYFIDYFMGRKANHIKDRNSI